MGAVSPRLTSPPSARTFPRVVESIQPILPLCSSLPVQAGDTGTTLLEEGGRTGCLYVLVEGKVGVFKGETCIATISQPGAVFGEVSVLLSEPHSATVRCLAPSRFHVVHDSLNFLQANPGFTLHVSRLLAQRLHAMTRYLMDLKAQFEDRSDHLGMVDEVLESLLHHQRKTQTTRSSPA